LIKFYQIPTLCLVLILSVLTANQKLKNHLLILVNKDYLIIIIIGKNPNNFSKKYWTPCYGVGNKKQEKQNEAYAEVLHKQTTSFLKIKCLLLKGADTKILTS